MPPTPLTKDHLTRAAGDVPHPQGGTLAQHQALLHIAHCDGLFNARLSLDTASKPQRADTARRVADALAQAAAAHAQDTTRITIEFVDHDGDVIDRATFPSAPSSSPVPDGGGGTRSVTEGAATTQGAVEVPSGSSTTPPSARAAPDLPRPPKPQALPGIGRIIAVGAGKGGVGKSTIAVNLAVGLARTGRAVGLLDADIYGPSLPTLLGLDALDQQAIDGRLQPFLVHGIKAVTMGKLVDADKPLIWRGPMAHGAFNQLAQRTDWGELDDLIIDLPPGTGDVPLTMAQSMSLAGAIIVCTPQRVAQDDAVRAARMFAQLGVDVLGVVENMSYFVGDDGKEYDLFGRGGAERMAQRLALPFLGSIPITMALRKNSDDGQPTRNFTPDTADGHALPAALETMVRNAQAQAALATMRHTRPTLSIS